MCIRDSFVLVDFFSRISRKYKMASSASVMQAVQGQVVVGEEVVKAPNAVETIEEYKANEKMLVEQLRLSKENEEKLLNLLDERNYRIANLSEDIVDLSEECEELWVKKLIPGFQVIPHNQRLMRQMFRVKVDLSRSRADCSKLRSVLKATRKSRDDWKAKAMDRLLIMKMR